ncbi:MAG: adenylyltransferase/cytidyltransferase family protein [Victivallaceae bacterium]|nr:adenylyltransferase/cytidyltransferase family protein [Victivallaceae bacterium]
MAQDDILTLDAAVKWRNALRDKHLKLVVTNGCFDILHRGHAEYLARARELGDALLVLVNSDASVRELKGPSRPINSETDRAYLLTALAAVDKAVVFDSRRCDAELGALAPDVYAKAGDYTLETLDPKEREALQNSGAKIVFMPFVAGFSTTGVVQKIQKDS